MPVNRRIGRSGFLHICQKTADNGVLFYAIEDYLVFFTLVSVRAEIHEVIVLAIDLMINHMHLGALFPNRRLASSFMNGILSVYARIYNKRHRLEGQRFKRPYRSAAKMSEKKIRDCLFYIWNNPVEKNAVKAAEEYRWNFLKYMDSDHPFSDPIIPSEATDTLLKLIRKVKAKREAGEYLGYGFFNDAYKSLSKKERFQLIDNIIVTYSVIRNDLVLKLFGTYQSLVMAVNSVTGNEYDLVDDTDNEDYRHYVKMIGIVRSEGLNLDSVCFDRPDDLRDEQLLARLKKRFRTEAGASDYEIAKFLHLL
jgi:REP element-mobilizing transposase RayT